MRYFANFLFLGILFTASLSSATPALACIDPFDPNPRIDCTQVYSSRKPEPRFVAAPLIANALTKPIITGDYDLRRFPYYDLHFGPVCNNKAALRELAMAFVQGAGDGLFSREARLWTISIQVQQIIDGAPRLLPETTLLSFTTTTGTATTNVINCNPELLNSLRYDGDLSITVRVLTKSNWTTNDRTYEAVNIFARAVSWVASIATLQGSIFKAVTDTNNDIQQNKTSYQKFLSSYDEAHSYNVTVKFPQSNLKMAFDLGNNRRFELTKLPKTSILYELNPDGKLTYPWRRWQQVFSTRTKNDPAAIMKAAQPDFLAKLNNGSEDDLRLTCVAARNAIKALLFQEDEERLIWYDFLRDNQRLFLGRQRANCLNTADIEALVALGPQPSEPYLGAFEAAQEGLLAFSNVKNWLDAVAVPAVKSIRLRIQTAEAQGKDKSEKEKLKSTIVASYLPLFSSDSMQLANDETGFFGGKTNLTAAQFLQAISEWDGILNFTCHRRVNNPALAKEGYISQSIVQIVRDGKVSIFRLMLGYQADKDRLSIAKMGFFNTTDADEIETKTLYTSGCGTIPVWTPWPKEPKEPSK